MTLQLLQTTIFDYLEELSMLSVVDSLAKPSVLPESDWDSQKLEELCSLKLLDSPKKSNHNIYSLKTLKAYSITTEGTHSEQSSPRLMNWGMMRNGSYLTAKISDRNQSHKIVRGCSLSDILEDEVDEKYFLSEEVARKLMTAVSSQEHLLQDTQQVSVKAHILKKLGSAKERAKKSAI